MFHWRGSPKGISAHALGLVGGTGVATLVSISAFVAVAMVAGGLSINVTSPQNGTWTAQSTVAVAGAASDPAVDQLLLDADSDLGGGTGFNWSLGGGTLGHNISPYETFRYFENFNGLSFTNQSIDALWGPLQANAYRANPSGLYSNTPPSIVWQDAGVGELSWGAAVPSGIVTGRVSFSYYCDANGHLEAYVLPGGYEDAQVLFFSTNSTSQARFDYELGSEADGHDTLFVRFVARDRTLSAGATCSIDEVEILLNFTRSAAPTSGTWTDDFSRGFSAVWERAGSIRIQSTMNGSDTPPELYIPPSTLYAYSAHWGFATELVAASISFHYVCAGNASLRVFADAAYPATIEILNATPGAGHTIHSSNVSASVANSTGLVVQFLAYSPLGSDPCWIDDFLLNWTVQGNQNLTYRGLYTTRAYDLGLEVNFTSMDWSATVPANTTLTVLFSTSIDNATFSTFQILGSSGDAPSPSSGRYVRLRVSFTSVAGLGAANVDRMSLQYAAIVVVAWSTDSVTWTPTNGTTLWTARVPLVGGSNTITVHAEDTTGASTLVSIVVLRDVFPPSAPGTPVSSPYVNSTGVTWTWTPAVDIGLGLDYYVVDAGTSPNGTDIAAARIVPGTSFTLSGQPDGSLVYLRARAVDAAGLFGPYSNASASTLVDLSPPSQVSFVSTPPSFTNGSTVAWTWTPASDAGSGLFHYQLLLGTTSGAGDHLASITNETSFSTLAGTNGLVYYLTVIPIDSAGNAGSPRISSRVLVDLESPAVPWTVSVPPAYWNRSSLSISWTAVADPVSGLSHYLLLIGRAAGLADVGEIHVNSTSFDWNAAVSGFRYFFSVRAVDRAGNVGATLASQNGTLVDREPPSAPFLAQMPPFVTTPNASLSWSAEDRPAALNSGISHHRVRVSVGGAQTTASSVTTPSFELSLVDGRAYRIYVASVDLAGNTGPEASVEFSADLRGPSAPPNLRVEIGIGERATFTARWDAANDTGSGVAYYLVDIGTSKGGSDVVAGFRVSGSNYTWMGAYGQSYYVRVLAVDQAGHQGIAAELSQPAREAAPQGNAMPMLAAGLAGGAAIAVAAVVLKSRRRRP